MNECVPSAVEDRTLDEWSDLEHIADCLGPSPSQSPPPVIIVKDSPISSVGKVARPILEHVIPATPLAGSESIDSVIVLDTITRGHQDTSIRKLGDENDPLLPKQGGAPLSPSNMLFSTSQPRPCLPLPPSPLSPLRPSSSFEHSAVKAAPQLDVSTSNPNAPHNATRSPGSLPLRRVCKSTITLVESSHSISDEEEVNDKVNSVLESNMIRPSMKLLNEGSSLGADLPVRVTTTEPPRSTVTHSHHTYSMLTTTSSKLLAATGDNEQDQMEDLFSIGLDDLLADDDDDGGGDGDGDDHGKDQRDKRGLIESKMEKLLPDAGNTHNLPTYTPFTAPSATIKPLGIETARENSPKVGPIPEICTGTGPLREFKTPPFRSTAKAGGLNTSGKQAGDVRVWKASAQPIPFSQGMTSISKDSLVKPRETEKSIESFTGISRGSQSGCQSVEAIQEANSSSSNMGMQVQQFLPSPISDDSPIMYKHAHSKQILSQDTPEAEAADVRAKTGDEMSENVQGRLKEGSAESPMFLGRTKSRRSRHAIESRYIIYYICICIRGVEDIWDVKKSGDIENALCCSFRSD